MKRAGYNLAPMDARIQAAIERDVAAALAEDIGSGDLTAQLIAAGQRARARVLTRENAVLCGTDWFDAVFRQLDPAIEVDWLAADGETIESGQTLCRLRGPARALLTGERTALNFLQTLSGTASIARQFATAVAGTRARVLDTRKTLPGLRVAQKYAVRCGGSHNHRFGLYDGVLIKENHIRSVGGIAQAIAAARAQDAGVDIEVEIETPDQLDEALAAGADIIMLDNFSLTDMRRAVAANRAHRRPAKLEASGNVTLETIAAIAATGVDFISTGSITKHVRAVDLSMQFEL